MLLLNNDCVIIPNFGGFMVHYVEARFDDRDNSFLPPYRIIGFNAQLKMNDSLLAQSYVEAYDISYPEAMKRIESEVCELQQILDNEGQYNFYDIGVLHKDVNGNFNFVPSEAGILTPSLYGLASFECEPIEQHNNKVADTLSNNNTISIVSFDVNEDEKKYNAKHHNIAKVKDGILISTSLLKNVAAVAIVFVVLMLIPTPISTTKTSVIKSEINTDLLYKVMPTEVVSKNKSDLDNGIKKLSNDNIIKKENINISNTNSDFKNKDTYYAVVLASRIPLKNAEEYATKLRKNGLTSVEVVNTNNFVKVVYGKYNTEKEARVQMNKMNEDANFAGCWVTKIN